MRQLRYAYFSGTNASYTWDRSLQLISRQGGPNSCLEQWQRFMLWKILKGKAVRQLNIVAFMLGKNGTTPEKHRWDHRPIVLSAVRLVSSR